MAIDKRFHSNIVSSRQVATEISNLLSRYQSAASVTSKTPIRKNAHRKQMLESFVNKFRAMNMGKFPSPTSAQKQVGGSYYSIKRMLQEMEYNSKMSPGSQHNKSNGPSDPTKDNNNQIKGHIAVSQEQQPSGSQHKSNGPVERVMENRKQTEGGNALYQEASSGIQEKSNGPIDHNLCEPGSNFDKNTGDTENSNITQNDTHDIATENGEKTEPKTRDDSFAFKDSGSKVEKQPDRTRSLTGDKGEKEKENELREKSSLWGNLRSLANGFISMWRK